MKKWYDPYPVITKNRFLNMIIGGRRIGKTYAFRKALVKLALKNDSKIAYVRQQKVDIEAITDFFGELKYDKDFENLEILDTPNFVYVNKKPLILKVAVSQYKKFKSSGDYPDYDTIWFDEFLQEDGRYLNDEPNKFMSIVMSIFRNDRPNKRIYMTTNTADYFNPYSESFKFYPKNKEFTYDKKRGILYQMVDMSEFITDKAEEKTDLEKLVESTEYNDLAFGNKFNDDNDDYISKKDSKSWEFCGLEIDSKRYGLWTNGAMMWITNYQSNNNVYSGDGKNISLPNFRTSQFGKEFRIFRLEGRVRFENRKLRSELLQIILK